MSHQEYIQEVEAALKVLQTFLARLLLNSSKLGHPMSVRFLTLTAHTWCVGRGADVASEYCVNEA